MELQLQVHYQHFRAVCNYQLHLDAIIHNLKDLHVPASLQPHHN